MQPDILIIGSGGGGLTAALRTKALGLTPLVVEKSSLIGGSTCYSGGGLWVPNNGLHHGVDDSVEEALKYMENLINPNYAGPASSRERKLVYLENASKMVLFLKNEGFKWVPSIGYPDYYPQLPGGTAGGRSIEPEVFDLRKLGEWGKKLNINPAMPTGSLPMYTYEGPKLVRAMCSLDGFGKAVQVFGLRKGYQWLLGRKPVTLGTSLIAQLLFLCLKRDVTIWTEAGLKQLIVENGKVTGAIINRSGKDVVVEVKRGLLLGAGGFARNKEMREKYQEHPITNAWTSASPNDLGDAISAAMDIGAATELLDDAWWGPTIIDPRNGAPMFTLFERALPHSIVVDKSGQRFTNEAQSYTTFVHDQYERNRTTPAIPAYLIMDQQFRSRYVLANILPGKTLPRDVEESGLIVQGQKLHELAQKLDVDEEGLKASVKRFNEMVRKGRDDDFNRGGNEYDRFFGDPASKYASNPSLGTIEKPPFYACKLVPGDLGTKGGLLTDVNARVIGRDGLIIRNLYAFGNTSASVMGRDYCGPGSTLGPALTFAYIAVNHASGSD
ncbi:uncharacterized protein PV09_09216 [Verruconis gallopava]|uniref:FAD-dependent oxidoreductase 2 FAD-binding domain-containing protein n=1 Tax=Verruconis gallopava TaxID=253628 RepID=A0A0D1YEC7_9PEZI|nr:uncharacterized protein PV09_09216 [Verruconis gallopava]KIV99041.1 hypothetical protein PV09_09216 [Verruconis gallopava]